MDEEAVLLVMAVLDLHRWKSMGLNSVRCECGVTVFEDNEELLIGFPADELFRRHISEAILEALQG